MYRNINCVHMDILYYNNDRSDIQYKDFSITISHRNKYNRRFLATYSDTYIVTIVLNVSFLFICMSLKLLKKTF